MVLNRHQRQQQQQQKRTPRRRLEEVDEDGFTLVRRRRRAMPEPTTKGVSTEFRRYLLRWPAEEDTGLPAMKRLGEVYPDLKVKVTMQPDGVIYLTPRSEEASFCIARLCREDDETWEKTRLELHEQESTARGVVMGYPLSFPLILLQEHPCVTFARRCTKRTGHDRTEPTHQVEVTLKGQFPGELDLGIWGSFSVRRWNPEPLRCFKCQGFGHVQKYCGRPELCGVCSQRHPTSECIRALKDGKRPKACCPNCGGNHHVWAKRCPERQRRMPWASRVQKEDLRDNHLTTGSGNTEPQPAQPSTATTHAPRRRRRHRRHGKRQPSQGPSAAPAEATTTANTHSKVSESVSTQTVPEETTPPLQSESVTTQTDSEATPPPPAMKIVWTQTEEEEDEPLSRKSWEALCTNLQVAYQTSTDLRGKRREPIVKALRAIYRAINVDPPIAI